MEKDTEKTNVKFLHVTYRQDDDADDYSDDENVSPTAYNDTEILAVFPDEPYGDTAGSLTCYAHLGQHSACCPEYVTNPEALTPEIIIRNATPEEYAELKSELEGVGYNLEII
jgi:hypothetical protein